jgi:hypothetical protein
MGLVEAEELEVELNEAIKTTSRVTGEAKAELGQLSKEEREAILIEVKKRLEGMKKKIPFPQRS